MLIWFGSYNAREQPPCLELGLSTHGSDHSQRAAMQRIKQRCVNAAQCESKHVTRVSWQHPTHTRQLATPCGHPLPPTQLELVEGLQCGVRLLLPPLQCAALRSCLEAGEVRQGQAAAASSTARRLGGGGWGWGGPRYGGLSRLLHWGRGGCSAAGSATSAANDRRRYACAAGVLGDSLRHLVGGALLLCAQLQPVKDGQPGDNSSWGSRRGRLTTLLRVRHWLSPCVAACSP